ncbi:MAG: hypothetical protein QX203_05440 [Methylococcaceae bacterium]
MNHQTANEIKQAIEPILNTINTALNQRGGLDLEGYRRLVKITKTSLDEVIGQANKVVNAVESAHQQRPVELINKAATRLSMIHNSIDRERALSGGLTEAHQSKVTELKKQGFTDTEINSIVPYPQSEIDAHTAKIECLKAERAGIEAFLKDAPRYDQSLLALSDLSCLLQKTEIPDEKPPIKLWSDGAFPAHSNDPKPN